MLQSLMAFFANRFACLSIFEGYSNTAFTAGDVSSHVHLREVLSKAQKVLPAIQCNVFAGVMCVLGWVLAPLPFP